MENRSSNPFFTPEEFRRILRCSRSLCYEMLREQKIRNFKLGKRYFIPASEVERLSRSTTAENDYPQKVDTDLW